MLEQSNKDTKAVTLTISPKLTKKEDTGVKRDDESSPLIHEGLTSTSGKILWRNIEVLKRDPC